MTDGQETCASVETGKLAGADMPTTIGIPTLASCSVTEDKAYTKMFAPPLRVSGSVASMIQLLPIGRLPGGFVTWNDAVPMSMPPALRSPRNAWTVAIPLPRVALWSKATPLMMRVRGTSWSPGTGFATENWIEHNGPVAAVEDDVLMGPSGTIGWAATGQAGSDRAAAKPAAEAHRSTRWVANR